MAVPIAFFVGLFLGYRDVSARWPFVAAAVAVALEIVVNGVRFGADSVVIWGILLTAVTVAGGIAGLWIGAWLRRRTPRRAE